MILHLSPECSVARLRSASGFTVLRLPLIYVHASNNHKISGRRPPCDKVMQRISSVCVVCVCTYTHLCNKFINCCSHITEADIHYRGSRPALTLTKRDNLPDNMHPHTNGLTNTQPQPHTPVLLCQHFTNSDCTCALKFSTNKQKKHSFILPVFMF